VEGLKADSARRAQLEASLLEEKRTQVRTRSRTRHGLWSFAAISAQLLYAAPSSCASLAATDNRCAHRDRLSTYLQKEKGLHLHVHMPENRFKGQ
jgi:hypothetical protein